MADPFRRRERNGNAPHLPPNPGNQQSSQNAWQHRQSSVPSEMDPQRSTLRNHIGPEAYGGYYQAPSAAGFGAGPSHGGSMSYHQSTTGYGQDTRQQQTQGFVSAYGSTAPGMIYNVQQSAAPGSVFDAGPSFPPRQHSGMPMIATDMTSTPYYPTDAQGAAAMTGGRPGPQSSSYQPHQNPADSRSGMVSGYTGSLDAIPVAEPLSSHSMADASQEQTAGTVTPETAGSGDYTDAHDAFASYRETLRQIFNGINSGALAPAAESLLGISNWLLSSVESLGLTTDDEELYEGRLILWRNFNHAWLALLERQRELMCFESGLHPLQSLIPSDDLHNLARELVRLCDSIERFGLVDYEYGVWEERIMSILTECLEIYNSGEDRVSGSSGSQQG